MRFYNYNILQGELMNYSRKELYKLLKSKKILALGTRGTVLINDDSTLLKIPKEVEFIHDYKSYLDSINSLKYKMYEFKESEINQKKFMEIGNSFNFVDFASDILYLDDMYIGVIIKWYKGYCKLFDYPFVDDKELIEIVKYLIECNALLIKKGIYHLDLLFINILYNKNDLKIIDIDGDAIKYSSITNELYEHFSYESLFGGLESLLPVMFKNKEFLERQSLYFDLISSPDYDTINYSSAKKLIKQIDREGIFRK